MNIIHDRVTIYMYLMVTALCSEGSMFRRLYVQKIFVQKVLCSEGSIFRKSNVQKVLCSEGPMFRRSYIQKVLCSENICSKGPIFRKFYVQKVLYSDIFRRSYIQKILFYVGKNVHFSVLSKLQCKITKQPPILAHSVKGPDQWAFLVARCSSSVRPQCAKIAIGTSINTI